MNKQTKQLRSESKLLKPKFIIGKNGLTDNVIKNIRDELMKEPLVKIKMLPTYIEDKDKKIVAMEIVDKTNSRLIDMIGFTLTVARK